MNSAGVHVGLSTGLLSSLLAVPGADLQCVEVSEFSSLLLCSPILYSPAHGHPSTDSCSPEALRQLMLPQGVHTAPAMLLYEAAHNAV
mmetsp:Transcript_14415/g.26094  ORF Transcript_14415/g.26094 Transcript_14415/m.26094 type:complete len:88 (+) Transcript_14415:2352-2615(+)